MFGNYGQQMAQGFSNPYLDRLNAMQAAMPQQMAQPQNGLTFVNGISGARRAYQMGASAAVPLFDANDDVFYIKITDAEGLPSVRAFRFSPIEQDAQGQKYVTRQEFEQLKGMILNGKQFTQTAPAGNPAGSTQPDADHSAV